MPPFTLRSEACPIGSLSLLPAAITGFDRRLSWSLLQQMLEIYWNTGIDQKLVAQLLIRSLPRVSLVNTSLIYQYSGCCRRVRGQPQLQPISPDTFGKGLIGLLVPAFVHIACFLEEFLDLFECAAQKNRFLGVLHQVLPPPALGNHPPLLYGLHRREVWWVGHLLQSRVLLLKDSLHLWMLRQSMRGIHLVAPFQESCNKNGRTFSCIAVYQYINLVNIWKCK